MEEPIEVKLYKCNHCNARIEGYEEAKKHVNVPVDSPLPLGLAFIIQNPESILTDTYILFEQFRLNSAHAHTYIGGKSIHGKGDTDDYIYSGDSFNSKDLRKAFQDGKFRFLDSEEVREFKDCNSGIDAFLKKKTGNEMITSLQELE